MRQRRKDTHLPPCVYRKNGAYWLVKRNKWTRLGRELPEALAEYGRIMATPAGGGMAKLIDDTLERAAERVKPRTLRQYRIVGRKIAVAFVESAPDQVRGSHVAQFLDHLRHTPAMANRCRTVLKMAFDLAVLHGDSPTNPVICVPPHAPKRRTRYLTDDEYAAIWKAASPAMRCIMDMAYLTAQRIGDILKIRLSGIEDQGLLIRPEKTSSREGEGKAILIASSPELEDVIRRARGLHGNVPRIYLFGQKKGGTIRSYRGVRDQFYRAAKKAGVEDAHLHDLRAKSLTDAKQQGLDPQALALHNSVSMTRRYLRDRKIAVVKGLSLRQPIDIKNILNGKQ